MTDSTDDDDICGLCGEPGADKIHQPYYWPTERRPECDLVHAECEQTEGARAYQEFLDRVGESGVQAFLRGCT